MIKSVLSLGLILLASQSMAAPRSTASSTTTVTTSPATEFKATFGPTLSVLPDTGETGVGFDFAFAVKAFDTTPIYLGLDIGLTFWGNYGGGVDDTGAKASKMGLSLLPMAVYEFNQGRLVRPYVGLEAGPYLNFGQLRTDAQFALFFKPGVNFAFNDKVGLGLETKFGSVAGVLNWSPQATVNFAF